MAKATISHNGNKSNHKPSSGKPHASPNKKIVTGCCK